ncbi:ferrous iron transport protein A [candidate division WOR-3 bacterium]|nr:ferrous iron transport protein A [candidate division WOR-3 bacterium]
MKNLSLMELKVGESGRVVEIGGGFGLRRKLEALGVREGVIIKKMSSQLMGGPVVIQVGRTQVALGRGMARRIIVKINEN